MALNFQPITTDAGLLFLRHCYSFVDKAWAQIRTPDSSGVDFSNGFRSSCSAALKGWQILAESEFNATNELETASGLRHRVDFLARHPTTSVIVELKHSGLVSAAAVTQFFASIMDCLAQNPKLLLTEVLPVIVSTDGFDEPALTACLALGIHPVGPGLRPLPVLADNLKRCENEMKRGLVLDDDDLVQRWEDICAGVNRLVLGLDQSWVSARCGYVSDEVMNVRRTFVVDALGMSRELRQINTDWAQIHASVTGRTRPPVQ